MLIADGVELLIAKGEVSEKGHVNLRSTNTQFLAH